MSLPGAGRSWLMPSRAVVPFAVAAVIGSLVWNILRHPEFMALFEAIGAAGRCWDKNWAGWGAFLPALLGHGRAVAVALGILASAGLGGARAGRWLAPRGSGALTEAGLGLGLLSLGVLALGLTGLLFVSLLAALFVGAALCGAGRRGSLFRPRFGGLRGWTWAAAGFLLLADLVAALSPEWFMDSLIYHLGLPERFLLGHRFAVHPENMLTFLPLGAEMLYTPALAFGGEEAAKVLNLGYGALLALAAGALAARAAGRWGWEAGAAALVLVSMPLAQVENEISFGDNLRALLESLALLALLGSGFRFGRGLLLAGTLAGLAFGTKYLAGLGAALMAAVAAAAAWRSRGTKAAAGAVLALAAAGFLAASPWLIRNWLAGGDPVYPFGRPLFSALGYGDFEFARWMADNRHYGVADMTLAKWVTLPVRMPLQLGTEFGTFTAGPLVLGLALLLLVRRSWSPAAAALLAVAAGEALIWSVTSHMARYLLPALAAFCALAAWVAGRLREERGGTWRPVAILMMIWAASSLVLRVHHRVNADEKFGTIGCFTGKAVMADVLAGRGWGRGLDGIPGGTVLLIGADQTLGIGRPWRGSSIYNVPLVQWWLEESPDARRVTVRARQYGIRTVLVDQDGLAELIRRGDFALSPRARAVQRAWWGTLRVLRRDSRREWRLVPPSARGTR